MTIETVGKTLCIKGQSLTRTSKKEFYIIRNKFLRKFFYNLPPFVGIVTNKSIVISCFKSDI